MKRLSWLILFLLCFSVARAHAQKVQSVQVELLFPPDSSLYPQLQERIELSFKSVGEKVLLGKDVAVVSLLSKTFSGTIKEVFDLVLRGFEIDKLEIVPDTETVLQIGLVPQKPLIRQANLKIDALGLAPGLLKILQENEPLFSQVATKVLAGVPVAALDWAEGVMLGILEQVVATQLPGFSVHLDLKVGEVTQIILYLAPTGPAVRSVYVNVSSSTIPTTLVRLLSGEAEEQAQLLLGIPVAFLSQYREQLEESIVKEVNQHPSLRKWGLKTELSLKPGEVTGVDLAVDSSYGRLLAGFTVNVGRSAPPPALGTHVGFFLGRQEFFLENTLALTSLDLITLLGTSWQVASKTQVAGTVDLGTGNLEYRFAHRIDDLQVGLRSDVKQGMWEVSIGKETSDLLIEFVGNVKQNYWLRLTAQI